MVIKVVEQGVLRPNPENPFARQSAEERREGMITALTRGIVGVTAKDAQRAADQSTSS
jgi:hypothetical protein